METIRSYIFLFKCDSVKLIDILVSRLMRVFWLLLVVCCLFMMPVGLAVACAAEIVAVIAAVKNWDFLQCGTQFKKKHPLSMKAVYFRHYISSIEVEGEQVPSIRMEDLQGKDYKITVKSMHSGKEKVYTRTSSLFHLLFLCGMAPADITGYFLFSSMQAEMDFLKSVKCVRQVAVTSSSCKGKLEKDELLDDIIYQGVKGVAVGGTSLCRVGYTFRPADNAASVCISDTLGVAPLQSQKVLGLGSLVKQTGGIFHDHKYYVVCADYGIPGQDWPIGVLEIEFTDEKTATRYISKAAMTRPRNVRELRYAV